MALDFGCSPDRFSFSDKDVVRTDFYGRSHKYFLKKGKYFFAFMAKLAFKKLTVREVRRETEDCVSIAFERPETGFDYLSGQYLTLRTNISGEEVRRSYSLCSAPYEGELRVAVKRVPNGKFSTYANEHLRAGDQLDVMPPQGKFSLATEVDRSARYVGFAAGSGITPVISILKSVLEAEPESSFLLFYGNRNGESIIFREELEALKNRYLGRLSLHHVLSREHPGSELFYGHLDDLKCRRFGQIFFNPTAVDRFFLCGPEAMIHALRGALTEQGVAPERIKFELFGTGTGVKKIERETPVIQGAKVTLIQDGQRIDFAFQKSDENILDAGTAAGADLPYACKGGVCCTCRAKVLDGKVDMLINYALEPDEVAAGYVLTCQAVPQSDTVTISFDD